MKGKRDPPHGRMSLPMVALVTATILIVSGCILYLNIVDGRSGSGWSYQEHYDTMVSHYEDENGDYADYEVDVAFLGDSITEGYDLSAHYPEHVCVNRGISGDTTFGLERRLDVSLYQLKPKVAVLLIGINNVYTMLDNYEDIIVGMKDNVPDTDIVICSLTPVGDRYADRNPWVAYGNAMIGKLATEHGCTFIDLYTPLFDVTSGEMRAECTEDGLHLNHLGYTIVSGVVRPIVSALLESWEMQRMECIHHPIDRCPHCNCGVLDGHTSGEVTFITDLRGPYRP